MNIVHTLFTLVGWVGVIGLVWIGYSLFSGSTTGNKDENNDVLK